MSASGRRFAVSAGILAGVVAVVVQARAADPPPYDADDLIKNINTYVEEWAKRPLDAATLAMYTNSREIDFGLPRERESNIRYVLETKVARMVKGLPKDLGEDLPLDVTVQEVRRLWRMSIQKEVGSAKRSFTVAGTTTLCPLLTAVALGYNDPKGQPDNAVRVTAVRLLVDLPGPHPDRVDAMLRLLRTKGADQGTLFYVIRELGQGKIVGAVPSLVGILGSENLVLQAAAARALGSIGDENALEPLLDLLSRTGDTVAGPPEEARNAVLATIAGIRGVVAANRFTAPIPARVLANLMRCVLSHPDRTVIAAATEAIRDISAYPDSLEPTLPEEEFQQGIERLFRWWLEQPGAKDHYEKFFRLEPLED